MPQIADRLNEWWRRTKRHRIPKAQAWWATRGVDVKTALGWGLITLAAFGRNTRAWEASIGLFLFYQVVMEFYAVYLGRKIEANRSKVDR